MSNHEMETDLLALLPPWYRNILDYQEICESETAQFEALAAAIHAVKENFFFQTMGAEAISQWEQVFGITPNPAAESLDFRRDRLLNRISTHPPFTLPFLRQKLDELIGSGKWTVKIDYPKYTLYVESSAQNQLYASEVAYTIGRIKPAHVVFVNTPYLHTGLALTETIDLTQRAYHYQLGAWGLGLSPFATDKPQGVIKMPSVPSIQEELLTAAAGFVSGDIAAARVNCAVRIEKLEKTVAGNTLTVTYPVAQSEAQEITQVELLDADGRVLTSSAVYVPVEANTVMKHTIPVQEGV